MRKYLALTILIGFLAISTLSLFGMSHPEEHKNIDCIAVSAGVFDCSATQSPIDFAASHLEAFRGFSEAVFSGGFVNLLIYSFALLLLVVSGLSLGLLQPFNSSSFGMGSPRFLSPKREDIAHWLSIHENSPSF